jgi:uncharacterized protein (UPF0335 family)
MSESVADEIIQSGYRRWLALEERKAEVASDLKELMAELKSGGLDPKVARAAFRRQRDSEDAQKVAADEEFEALVDLYLASLARDARKEAA